VRSGEHLNSLGLRSFGKLMGLLLVLAVLVAAAGCGTEKIDTSQIKAAWESHYSDHFVFYFPPGSPRAAKMASFADDCEEMFTHVMRVLQVEIDEPVDFFVINTDAQGDSLFGRPPGFFADGQIFMRIGQHPGGLVALAGCYFIDKGVNSFDVLETGMYQLYARPSVNVHAVTYGFERKSRFIPLEELADTTFPKDQAVYEAEAASLCAFLLAKHGPDRFKMLWRSVLDFTESIEKVYGTEHKKLEKQWQMYYRRESSRT